MEGTSWKEYSLSPLSSLSEPSRESHSGQTTEHARDLSFSGPFR